MSADPYQNEQKINIRTVAKGKSDAAPIITPAAATKAGGKSGTGKLVLKLFGVFVIFAFTALLVFGNRVSVSEESAGSWLTRLPLVKQLKNLAESADRSLKGEADDRINILLLGMGGVAHDGGYLTDTIMLASIEPSTNKVALVSIPRDLTVPVEDMGMQKINSINAFAEMSAKGSGGLAISQAVSDLLGVPIDYYVRVDFEGFVNIVNELDGLDVYVENTLDDYRYPVMGREDAEDYESRFEHLHVDQGWQHMDGELALKYARSRHAAGAEGSDFARARRQQRIMAAAKDKLLSRSTLLNPDRLLSILNEFQDHVATNFKIWEMLKLWDILKDVSKDDIITRVLDSSPGGLLYESYNDQGAFVLTPRSGDFAEIQYYVKNIFADVPAEDKTQVTKERPTIEVRNGTWINGLASQVALDLEKLGFVVVRIGNSSRQNFQKTVIYDLSYGEKNDSLKILRLHTGANVSLALPDWLVEDIAQENKLEKSPIQPDFIIILGQESDKTGSGADNPENEASQ